MLIFTLYLRVSSLSQPSQLLASSSSSSSVIKDMMNHLTCLTILYIKTCGNESAFRQLLFSQRKASVFCRTSAPNQVRKQSGRAPLRDKYKCLLSLKNIIFQSPPTAPLLENKQFDKVKVVWGAHRSLTVLSATDTEIKNSSLRCLEVKRMISATHKKKTFSNEVNFIATADAIH